MQSTRDLSHLRLEINTVDCDIPADERARLQSLLAPLAEAVSDWPAPALAVKAIFHLKSRAYHVEFKLSLPGRTLFTSEADAYLDSALARCAHKLVNRVQDYKEHPDRGAAERDEKRAALDRDVVAPEDPASGPLADAVQAGDYRAFRTRLAGYEEWLRKRVGRWVQRYPQAEARVGRRLLLGDLVE